MNSQPCATTSALLILERAARLKAYSHADILVAARFGDLAVLVMRRRFRHVDGCERCLLAELEAA